jgi:hypothetical protein
VGGAAAGRVVADEDPLHRDAGEAALVLFQVVDEVVADVLAQRHRRAGRHFFGLADRPPHLAQRHVGEAAEAGQLRPLFGRVLRQFLRVELQRQAGPVRDQDVAFAVEDVAPGGDPLELAAAVVLRLGQVLGAGEHLQVPEPEEEHREERHRDPAEDGNPQRHAIAGSGTFVRALVHVALRSQHRWPPRPPHRLLLDQRRPQAALQ